MALSSDVARVKVCALLLIVSLAAGCANGPTWSGRAPVPARVPVEQLRETTLVVGDQKGGTSTLLRASGLLSSLPFTVRFATFTAGPPELEAANAGAIDIAQVGNTPPIFSAAAKAQNAVVGAARGPASGDAILVPADSTLRDVKSLRGKTIAVTKGSSAHGHLLAQLARVGMSIKDVKTSFLQPSDAYAAFTQHRIDAWSVWDPYTSQAQLQQHARVLVDGTGVTNALELQVASKQALANPQKSTAIGLLLVAIGKAQLWAQRYRGQWSKAYAAATGLDPAVSLKQTRRGVRVPVALDAAVIESEQRLADSFSRNKSIPFPVNFAEFTDDRYTADLASIVRKGPRS